jgi:hypothetical protein
VLEDSNGVGEFDFALQAGSVGNNRYNVIALPVDVTAQLPDADALATYIGSSVQQVLHWNSTVQTYESWYPPFSFGQNFELETGQSYWVQLDHTAPFVISFVGSVPASSSVEYNLVGANPTCQLNQILLPLDQPGITTAAELAASIGNVAQVLSWDPNVQTFSTWYPDFNFGTNFSTQIGYPYHLCLKQSTSWP